MQGGDRKEGCQVPCCVCPGCESAAHLCQKTWVTTLIVAWLCPTPTRSVSAGSFPGDAREADTPSLAATESFRYGQVFLSPYKQFHKLHK